MEPIAPTSLDSGVCKWCGLVNSEVSFENARLCHICYEKALLAVQNPKLCDICSSLATDQEVLQALFSKQGYSHAGFGYLRRSAGNGCGLCRLLLLQDPNPSWQRIGEPLTLFAEREEGLETPSDGEISSLYFTSEQEMFTLRLSVAAAADDPAAKYVSQRPVEANLGKDNTIQEIRSWLDECLTAHPKSLSLDGQSFSHRFPLPTRVIDVGTDTEPIAKIFQPSGVIHEQYITLSYCWGEQRFLTSVSANIAAHMERLPESNLPQTFTDAIDVTRKLGFRYLWIDALCIIQDSAEDKTIEIDAMGNIYRNSTLTIAVVNAAGVADGFLRTKPRLQVDIPYHCPDGSLGTVKVSPQETVDLWQEPLYTRAWCLQENLLSSRLLSFTNTEILWQCESCPMKRPNTSHVAYQYENPQLGKSPFARLPPLLPNPAPHDLDAPSSVDPALDATRYSTWKDFVQNYTRRKLTVASDRLPAIVGISQKLKDTWSDEYCAGIWKRQFIPSLTWRRKESVQGPGAQYWPPLSEYRAPSWSWAGIEGPIEFDYRFDLGNARGVSARLISCEVVPRRHQAPLGEVQSGKAVLEASLIPARDVPIRGYAGQDPESYRTGGILSLDDHPKEWQGRAHRLEGDLFENAWAMLLGEGRDGSGKATRTTALILVPSLDETESFKRVGFWTSYVRGQSKLWVGAKKRRTVTLV